MEYYEALQKLISHDDFTKSLGFTVHEMGKDYVSLEAGVTMEHCNGYGALHGGYLMALADCAAGYAAFTDGRYYVTQSNHMSFLKNVSSGKIFINARVLKRGRLVSVVRVEIFSGEECLLCEGSFNCYCIEPGESGK
ncbi:PaaI family thioesterase [Gemmiger formicilis]|uniref:PaaI family thioesterase n=1 Tax=Gemmiger formicilis TaxID=745368 RepID=UPI00210DB0AE|nr:PaaI family thioesterase [Gemmiger formicilis]MCQ5079999.1 PaaI family thioesterase [Gemmiger formicilis]MCQ5117255.1 PaaI family thioesterase [Gemmiger formicilis]